MFYLVLFAIIITVFSALTFGYQLLILLPVWFSLCIIALKLSESKRDKALFVMLMFIYPLIEFTIKVFISGDIIPYSWAWLNRIEHGLFAAVTTFMIYHIIKYFKYSFKAKTFSHLQNTIISYGFAFLLLNFFGILNEILEYYIRVYSHLFSTQYYQDTLMDLISNVIGSLIIIILLSMFISNKNKD